MPPLRKKLPSLSEQFDLGDQFLAAPNTEALKSAIIRAHDKRDDNPIVLKYWQKTGSSIDNDLREIWRLEMRQAERVRAYPGAEEVTVELMRYGEASDAFFVTMPSDIAPLDVIARHARPDHWLKNLALPRQRIVLWRNAERLSRALRAVHNQGLIFGSLDRTSVFTASANVADFRLGGCEWCVGFRQPISLAGVVPAGCEFQRRRGATVIALGAADYAFGLLSALRAHLSAARAPRRSLQELARRSYLDRIRE